MPFEPTFEVSIRDGYNAFTTHLTQTQISSRLNGEIWIFVDGVYTGHGNFEAKYLFPGSKIILTPPPACDGTTYRFDKGSLGSYLLTKNEIIKSTRDGSFLFQLNESNPYEPEDLVNPVQLIDKNLEEGTFFRSLPGLVGGPTNPVELSNGAIFEWTSQKISDHMDFYQEKMYNVKISDSETRYIAAPRLNQYVSPSGRFLVNGKLLTLEELDRLDPVPDAPLPLVQAAKISLGYDTTAFAQYHEILQIVKHASGPLHAKIGEIIVRNGDLSTTEDGIDDLLEAEFLKTDSKISLFSLGC